MEKFMSEVGSVALQGIDALGDFRFSMVGKQAGFVVNEIEIELPEVVE